MTKEQLETFFTRPGINKSGICQEAGVTMQYLNRVLRGTQPVTDGLLEKIMPVLENYGFEVRREKEQKTPTDPRSTDSESNGA